ncbi:MAG: tRNA (N(6)-L-threonylcarbamoyladenosine(37)-C(2))-methylthiotransferase MtaB, partial [Armatimonadetes bacterium]|nr:tRNA (N(6)-L-threonylcarbamoyladenosine(37)-C(2))-methylthiotransferase MtaB [Armatimonadota bacterium]
MSSARVRIITLGCKVNQCDSDEIARSLAARGYTLVGRRDWASTYIVNTCTVTSMADAKARKLVRRIARSNPDAIIIVTGCLAERDPSACLDLPGVTAVVPNRRKSQLADFLPHLQAPMFPTTYLPARTRAFLKVQDGCDHRCAYCAVPDARGAPTSKPLRRVLDEVQRMIEAGAQEVVLCGIRLGAYGVGRDGESLAVLLRNLREVHPRRLRLSSIEPLDVTEELLEEMADHPALCHHLHLPLQSGDDAVLAAMDRGYATADFRRLATRIREHWPDVALTTDAMVGFPGETDDQFVNSLAFLEEMQFTRIHVFPYSRRLGTPAADRQDQVLGTVMKDRVRQTLELAD